MNLLIEILLMPVSFLAIAFFELSETALTSLSRITIEQLKTRYPHRKPFLGFWEQHPERVLASLVLGSTLSTVVCGVLSASIAEILASLWNFSAAWLVPCITFLAAFLVFVFAQVLPKITARLYSERIAPLVIIPLIVFSKISYPLTRFFIRIAGIFVRILGAEPQNEIPIITAAELNGMIEPENVTEPAASSHRLLKNILELGQVTVKDVGRSRDNIFAVDIRKNPKEVIQTLTEAPFSRIPVYSDSLDNIVGIIYSKDLLTAWRTEGLILIPDLIRPVYFTSENTPVSQLLREFKKGHYHLAIIRDQQGRVTGIITIEDILEQIAGEVYDESR